MAEMARKLEERDLDWIPSSLCARKPEDSAELSKGKFSQCLWLIAHLGSYSLKASPKSTRRAWTL